MDVKKFDQGCNKLGFGALSMFASFKTLAAAVVIVALSVFSWILSFNLGEALNANGGWWLYPYMLAFISLFGLYLAGYMVLRGVKKRVRAVACLWLLLIIFLDVFAAWTMLCAADHKGEESTNSQRKTYLTQRVAKKTAESERYLGQVEETKWHFFKTAYANKSAAADQEAQKAQEELDNLNETTYDAVRAVFYVTPLLRKDPEVSMTMFRLFVALIASLTPFVGTFLVVVHLSSVDENGHAVGPGDNGPGDDPEKKPLPEKGKKRGSLSGWFGRSSAPQGAIASAPSTTQASAPVSRDLLPGMSDSIAREYFSHMLDDEDKVVQLNAPQANRSQNRSAPTSSPARDRSGAVTGAVTQINLPANIEERIKDDETRYQVVEYLVRRGAVRPSTRAIKSLGIGSTNAQHYLDRMASKKEGVIIKGGPGKASKLVESKRIHDPVEKFERLIAA